MIPHNDPVLANNIYAQFGHPHKIAEGILGVSFEDGDCVIIPFFMSTDEGKGHASRFIEELKTKYKLILIPNLISGKLEGMLIRRGFKKKRRYVKQLKEHCDVMYWKA